MALTSWRRLLRNNPRLFLLTVASGILRVFNPDRIPIRLSPSWTCSWFLSSLLNSIADLLADVPALQANRVPQTRSCLAAFGNAIKGNRAPRTTRFHYPKPSSLPFYRFSLISKRMSPSIDQFAAFLAQVNYLTEIFDANQGVLFCLQFHNLSVLASIYFSPTVALTK